MTFFDRSAEKTQDKPPESPEAGDRNDEETTTAVGAYKAPDGIVGQVSLVGIDKPIEIVDGHVNAPETPEACQALLDLGFTLVK